MKRKRNQLNGRATGEMGAQKTILNFGSHLYCTGIWFSWKNGRNLLVMTIGLTKEYGERGEKINTRTKDEQTMTTNRERGKNI